MLPNNSLTPYRFWYPQPKYRLEIQAVRMYHQLRKSAYQASCHHSCRAPHQPLQGYFRMSLNCILLRMSDRALPLLVLWDPQKLSQPSDPVNGAHAKSPASILRGRIAFSQVWQYWLLDTVRQVVYFPGQFHLSLTIRREQLRDSLPEPLRASGDKN